MSCIVTIVRVLAVPRTSDSVIEEKCLVHTMSFSETLSFQFPFPLLFVVQLLFIIFATYQVNMLNTLHGLSHLIYTIDLVRQVLINTQFILFCCLQFIFALRNIFRFQKAILFLLVIVNEVIKYQRYKSKASNRPLPSTSLLFM